MKQINELTDDQIRSCITGNINFEIFKTIVSSTEKLINNYDGEGNSAYLVSEGHSAALYCKEINNSFTSPEHTPEWEAEFNTHYDSVVDACKNLNVLLTS